MVIMCFSHLLLAFLPVDVARRCVSTQHRCAATTLPLQPQSPTGGQTQETTTLALDCRDAKPLSSRRIRTVPIDGCGKRIPSTSSHPHDSLYNDVQYEGIVPCLETVGIPIESEAARGSSWRRERDSNPREPFRALYAFQAYLFNRSSTSPRGKRASRWELPCQ